MSEFIYKEIEGELYAFDNPEHVKKVQEKKYNLFLKKSNIPDFYHDINFKDYLGNKESKEFKEILYYANNCYKPEFDHVSLYMYGSHSTQKCVTKDTLILTSNGFKYIDSFSENKKGFCEKKISILGKGGFKDSSHFFEEDVEETIKVILDNGIELEGTPEHPVLVLNNMCLFEFKKLEELGEDDYVILQNNTQVFNNNPQPICFNYTKNVLDTCSINLQNIPGYLTKDLARFLGYYIANGSLSSSNSLSLSTKNEKIQKDLQNILSNFGLNFRLGKNKIDHGVSSVQFISFLYYLLGISKETVFTARYKFVPKYILEGTRENQIEFLRALIDCDSYLSGTTKEKRSLRLGYFTASKRLAKEVQLMLLNLGVYSRIYYSFKEEYNHTYYEIWIAGKDLEKYFNITKYSNKYEIPKISTRTCGFYYIPKLKEKILKLINEHRKAINVKKNGMFFSENNGMNIYYPKDLSLIREHILKIHGVDLEMLSELKEAVDNNISIDVNNLLKSISNICEYFYKNPNYIYVPISKIEKIKEKKIVYDFTIPIEHNFYSNGVISHNTALECNILKQCIRNGMKVKFILAGSLISKLIKLQGYSRDEGIEKEIKELKSCDIIAIDDIGDIKKSIQWSKSDLITVEWDNFFREVLASKTKIIMTSNASIENFKQYFSDSIYELLDRNTHKIYLSETIKKLRQYNVSKVFENIV